MCDVFKTIGTEAVVQTSCVQLVTFFSVFVVVLMDVNDSVLAWL